MSLTQKLLLFLVLVVMTPLVLSVATITSRSNQISARITTSINALETRFTFDLAGSTDGLIKASSDEMNLLMQHNWERLAVVIAADVAHFLYQRDRDLLFLADALSGATPAGADDKQRLIEAFRLRKTAPVTIPAAYRYDAEADRWRRLEPLSMPGYSRRAGHLENAKSFQYTTPATPPKEARPIYREITLVDLAGREVIKSSTINPNPITITDRKATFAGAERYFDAIQTLKKGEIYVSEVTGLYQPAHLIGVYSKAQTESAGIAFAPHRAGYAGAENPAGQRFDGIIRFATPLFEGGVKTGYLTMALDHRHIMEFSDYIIPENNYLGNNHARHSEAGHTQGGADAPRGGFYTDIKDAAMGNYAFMWDHKGRNIAHPREYFIAGFDAETGGRVPPWMSADMAAAYGRHRAGGGTLPLNTWLEAMPPYEGQSRRQMPNQGQVSSGRIPLDCRYLDFAPQCAGWNQINRSGGYGSFQVFWSGIWKLTTAATIPYYTGRYGASKRGFGFVTIGANLGEFTQSGMQTEERLKTLIGNVNQTLSRNIRQIGSNSRAVLAGLQKQMITIGLFTFFGVLLFIFALGHNIRTRVGALIGGVNALSAGDLTARVKTKGRDELATIGTAFNAMAETLEQSRRETENVNSNLERMVAERTEQLHESNQQISDSIDYASRIQRSLLPDDGRLKAALGEMALIWQPKDVVGGDFYWHKTIGGREYLVVMDCTGHGVPGAFMTMVATAVLEQITTATTPDAAPPDVADLMHRLHDGVSQRLNQIKSSHHGGGYGGGKGGYGGGKGGHGGGRGGKVGMANDGLDAVMLSIPRRGDTVTPQEVHFCGASMDLYTVSTDGAGDGAAKRWRGGKASLGYAYTRKTPVFERVSIPLDATPHGMTAFVIASDGITTQIGTETRLPYGYRRFLETLQSAGGNDPERLNAAIMDSFRAWQGAEERRDDVTLISFRPIIP